jgi:hypothetical protein
VGNGGETKDEEGGEGEEAGEEGIVEQRLEPALYY